jgi:hypothetical protein
MAESSSDKLDTSRITEWRSIVTLVLFVLTSEFSRVLFIIDSSAALRCDVARFDPAYNTLAQICNKLGI